MLQFFISTKVAVAKTKNEDDDMAESSNVNPLELQVHNLPETIQTFMVQI